MQQPTAILNMGTLQLVAESGRAMIPLTRNEVHHNGGSTSVASHRVDARHPSMPSSVASSGGLNFTQFMKEAPLQFTKRRMTAADQAPGAGPVSDRANSASQACLLPKKQRLIRKKDSSSNHHN